MWLFSFQPSRTTRERVLSFTTSPSKPSLQWSLIFSYIEKGDGHINFSWYSEVIFIQFTITELNFDAQFSKCIEYYIFTDQLFKRFKSSTVIYSLIPTWIFLLYHILSFPASGRNCEKSRTLRWVSVNKYNFKIYHPIGDNKFTFSFKIGVIDPQSYYYEYLIHYSDVHPLYKEEVSMTD